MIGCGREGRQNNYLFHSQSLTWSHGYDWKQLYILFGKSTGNSPSLEGLKVWKMGVSCLKLWDV